MRVCYRSNVCGTHFILRRARNYNRDVFFFLNFFHARNNKEPLDRGGKYRATRDNNDENDIRKRIHIYIYTHTHTQ